MPGTETIILKKQLPIIYVIDTSGSMSGANIACVNDAIRESIKVMKDKASGSPDVDIKVGVLRFSTGAEWVTNGLVDLEHFYWSDLTASGGTDFGAALKELDAKFSKNSYLKSEIGYAVPIIICMSDGQDSGGWEKIFEEVKANNAWVRGSIRVSIAIGDDADLDMLGRFCKDPAEYLIKANNLDALKGLIVALSATASMMGQSRIVNKEGENVDGSSLMQESFDQMKDITGLVVNPGNVDFVDSDNDTTVFDDNPKW